MTSRTGEGPETASPAKNAAGPGSGPRGVNLLRRDVLANAAVIAILVAGMELWSGFVPDYIMPPPAKTADATVRVLANDSLHILITVVRLTIAVAFALVVGSAIGVAMGMIRPVEPFLKSIVVIDTGIPALSWMLFAVFWFKGAEARVFFILAVILIPFYALNVHDGIRALSRDLVEMVETFRPSRWQVFRLLILPHIVPYILMTTKSIIGYATRMTVFAELVCVSTGMGARMGLAQNNFQMDSVIAWTIVLVVVNFGIQGLVSAVEKPLLRWRPEVAVR
jgi:NitT/TauT family transport system permease protein